MDWHHYRFRSVWDLDAAPDAVFGVLKRAADYPDWWPQVREVTPLDERSGIARFRSVIPYDLFVRARESRNDPRARVLEMEMTGDLEGWARWTLSARGSGTRALYEQEVDVNKPLLRRLAVAGRPFFLANHALMMRAGRRGLRKVLARPHTV
ncbi:SRPBCC family protein [Streptomyces sp. NPDC050433]|uniref:SRPBCC family protein n=1 Tax=unclassified Streptomyces TaxID=2593676 RepID=UPI0034221173